MGKKRHQKDRGYVTAKEHKEEWGGHKVGVAGCVRVGAWWVLPRSNKEEEEFTPCSSTPAGTPLSAPTPPPTLHARSQPNHHTHTHTTRAGQQRRPRPVFSPPLQLLRHHVHAL
jgi:hypothetical protein